MVEGQFKNDELDGTFGRIVYMEGTARMGWFKKEEYQLHGYGKDKDQQLEGLF